MATPLVEDKSVPFSEADINKMSVKKLNQFVLEQDISGLPEYFIELKPDDKKKAVLAAVLGGKHKMPKPGVAKGEVAPKTKTKTKTKATAKNTEIATAGIKGEVLPPLLDSFNLPDINFEAIATQNDAVALAMELVEVGDYALYHIGGIFVRMVDQKWFMGHDDFKKCCIAEFGIEYRKAAYLMKIYRTIDGKGIAWQDVVKCGWTKLKELLPILTPKNAKGWAEKAQSMTTLALIEHVKAETGDDKSVALVATKTFKLHDDQQKVVNDALLDAKIKGHTEVDSVALELICQSYLGSTVPTLDPIKYMQSFFKTVSGKPKGLKIILSLLNKYYDDVSIELDIPEKYGM